MYTNVYPFLRNPIITTAVSTYKFAFVIRFYCYLRKDQKNVLDNNAFKIAIVTLIKGKLIELTFDLYHLEIFTSKR